MPKNQLSQAKKLDLFDLVTRFRISENISMEYRGHESDHDADFWAIVRHSSCYSRKNGWLREPLSSRRDAIFRKQTRYSLRVAIEIVESKEFRDKYI